jgi:hypothetical protein
LENSEVLPLASVAVAVMNCPETSVLTWKEKEPTPSRLVLTFVSVRSKVLPSSLPDKSAVCVWLEKNWRVKVFLGRLFSFPLMVVVVVPPEAVGRGTGPGELHEKAGLEGLQEKIMGKGQPGLARP